MSDVRLDSSAVSRRAGAARRGRRPAVGPARHARVTFGPAAASSPPPTSSRSWARPGRCRPWELTDAIDRGDTETALVTLRRMLRAGDRHPLQLMATLHNHYLRMLRLDGAGRHRASGTPPQSSEGRPTRPARRSTSCTGSATTAWSGPSATWPRPTSTCAGCGICPVSWCWRWPWPGSAGWRRRLDRRHAAELSAVARRAFRHQTCCRWRRACLKGRRGSSVRTRWRPRQRRSSS